jgi:hypothetical protein
LWLIKYHKNTLDVLFDKLIVLYLQHIQNICILEYKVSDLQIVTRKSVSSLLKCSDRSVSTFIKQTRLCYNKPTGAITLGQLLKANNLEK